LSILDGLHNAGPIFYRMMTPALKDQIDRNVATPHIMNSLIFIISV
jgi:hypothetical protein